MISYKTWIHYLKLKVDYGLRLKGYPKRKVSYKELDDSFVKHMVIGQLTFPSRHKGPQMIPILPEKESVLLIRKMPLRLYMDDLVQLKDPEDDSNYIVRRMSALEGYEMGSIRRNEEPFDLEEGECWVLSDNKKLTPKEANDSRWFGPVPYSSITGRVIYNVRSQWDHGPVLNCLASRNTDFTVLEIELDVDNMIKLYRSF